MRSRCAGYKSHHRLTMDGQPELHCPAQAVSVVAAHLYDLCPMGIVFVEQKLNPINILSRIQIYIITCPSSSFFLLTGHWKFTVHRLLLVMCSQLHLGIKLPFSMSSLYLCLPEHLLTTFNLFSILFCSPNHPH